LVLLAIFLLTCGIAGTFLSRPQYLNNIRNAYLELFHDQSSGASTNNNKEADMLFRVPETVQEENIFAIDKKITPYSFTQQVPVTIT